MKTGEIASFQLLRIGRLLVSRHPSSHLSGLLISDYSKSFADQKGYVDVDMRC